MMNYSFTSAGRLEFGFDKASILPAEMAALGKRALVLTGSNTDRHRELLEACSKVVEIELRQLNHEPDVKWLAEESQISRALKVDMIVGLGGGSVMDGAKAIAAMTTNEGELFRYLEVVGEGRPIESRPLPCIAVPTTAGTGSEVTKNAVLASHEHQVKVSLRHPWMMPILALVDPGLCFSCPASITAASGLDALTQVIEPFLSCLANVFTDSLCRTAIPMAMRTLPLAYKDPQNRQAREAMSHVSVCGGLALANAGLGAVHAVAGPMGGMSGASHGQICARLLPEVLRANELALRTRMPESPVLPKFRELALMLVPESQGEMHVALSELNKMIARMGIPSLSQMGLKSDQLDELVGKSLKASSMKGNPIQLNTEELLGVLTDCW